MGTTAQLGGDGLSRTMGLVVGAGVGMAVMYVSAIYLEVSVYWLLPAPGIGLQAGAGLFSYRRSAAWGVVTAVLGCAWTILNLWFVTQTDVSVVDVAGEMVTSFRGGLDLVIVAACGWLIGSGWEKPLPQLPLGKKPPQGGE